MLAALLAKTRRCETLQSVTVIPLAIRNSFGSSLHTLFMSFARVNSVLFYWGVFRFCTHQSLLLSTTNLPPFLGSIELACHFKVFAIFIVREYIFIWIIIHNNDVHLQYYREIYTLFRSYIFRSVNVWPLLKLCGSSSLLWIPYHDFCFINYQCEIYDINSAS